MKISKERLNRIILEETAFLLQETAWTDEQLSNIFQTLEFNRQKIDAWKTNVNKFIASILKNINKLENEVSVIKQQIPGLEYTDVSPPELQKLLPTRTTVKQVAENKNNYGGELVSTEY